MLIFGNPHQRWSRGHKAQGQGHKKSEAKAKDRNARGQGPRTQAQVFSKKKAFKKIIHAISKKTPSKFFFRRSSKEEYKKGLRKLSLRFLAFSKQISRVQKIVLSSSRGQGNFRGLEALRPRPRTIDLRGRGQSLQNVSSRTSSRPRASLRTPPLVHIEF